MGGEVTRPYRLVSGAVADTRLLLVNREADSAFITVAVQREAARVGYACMACARPLLGRATLVGSHLRTN